MKKTNTSKSTNKKADKTTDKTTDKTEAPLTKIESTNLTKAITAMRNALKNFLTIGHNHNTVKDLIIRKYGKISTFAEEALGITESSYYQRVRASDVYDVLKNAGMQALPHVESVCRPVTLNVLETTLKDCDPKQVKGITAEQCLVQIWQKAIDMKLEKLNKARVPAGMKLTANEVYAAKAQWEALHTGSPKKNPVPKPKGDKVQGKQPDTSGPSLPSGLPTAKDGTFQDTTGGSSSAVKAVKDLTREELLSKVAEQRTELARLRQENSRLSLQAANKTGDWHTSKLFKDIFAAGKKVVIAKAMETNDTDLVKAVGDLEKILAK